MRNPRIAYNTDNVSNIPVGELNLKFKKLEASFEILFTIRSFPTHESLSNIPLSDQSNLRRGYF